MKKGQARCLKEHNFKHRVQDVDKIIRKLIAKK